MKKTAIDPMFEAFIENVYPDACPRTRHALRRAFYVGAVAFLTHERDIVSGKVQMGMNKMNAIDKVIREIQTEMFLLSVDCNDASAN